MENVNFTITMRRLCLMEKELGVKAFEVLDAIQQPVANMALVSDVMDFLAGYQVSEEIESMDAWFELYEACAKEFVRFFSADKLLARAHKDDKADGEKNA